MKILAIETSCDETAIAILECSGDQTRAEFTVLGNALLSQIEIHQQYGGVFPALAKREHAKNLVPILEAALEEAELLHEETQAIPPETRDSIAAILSREPGLSEAFFDFVTECEVPAIDAIAVTAGPGLEPALWVGINFARALALLWDKPLVAINHLEGHILAGIAKAEGTKLTIEEPRLPLLALGIAGGHTDLVLMRQWLSYETIGQTLDDSVGEAFDKVARMLGLPYPGGPEISKLAEQARTSDVLASELGHRMSKFTLPRPMLHSGTCDFSFSGLKTAVLNLLKTIPDLTSTDKVHIAHEFENAVADVLWKKTAQALEETGAQTLVIGGGVSANTHIRRVFTENVNAQCLHVSLRIPTASLTTDNAIMIALAGYFRALRGEYTTDLTAQGNLSLSSL